MSLETQVANLVTATNSLTGTVNTKIADIDSAKNTAVADMNNRVSTFNSTDLPAMQADVSSALGTMSSSFYSAFNVLHKPHRYSWEAMSRYTSHQASLDRGWNGVQPIFQAYTAADIVAAQAAVNTTHGGYSCPTAIVTKAREMSDSCCEDGTIHLIRIETAAKWSGWIGFSGHLRVHGHHMMGAWLTQTENNGTGIAGDLLYNNKWAQHTMTNWNHDSYSGIGDNPTGTAPKVVWLCVPYVVAGQMSQVQIDAALGQGMFTATIQDNYRVDETSVNYPGHALTAVVV